MRAVEVDPSVEGGGLRIVEVDDPQPARAEVVIDIAAAGVNRADTGQRRGRYDPPSGAPPWPGLECAGVVSAVGAGVTRWGVGDRVCALLAGGGYAEKAVTHADLVMDVPSGVSFVDAAAVPEAAATVWSNLMVLGRLSRNESVLIHGGSSGIGTLAIQMARQRGARVFVTAGTDEKLQVCHRLGAEQLINYRTHDFVERVMQLTCSRGVDVVLDIVGGAYLQRNIEVLAPEGRLILIGGQGGFDARLDIREVMSRRAIITGSMLRSRSMQDKTQIIADVARHVLPALETGCIRPVVHAVLPLSQAMAAHEIVEASYHVGKIVLVP